MRKRGAAEIKEKKRAENGAMGAEEAEGGDAKQPKKRGRKRRASVDAEGEGEEDANAVEVGEGRAG